MWKYLVSLDNRRHWYMQMVRNGPLKQFYDTPFPSPDTDWQDVTFLAVDYETTGLNHKRDEIISIGFTEIENSALKLNRSNYYLVKPQKKITEKSAVIHGIMNDQMDEALDLKEAITLLLTALQGKVLVAHHAFIEYKFLSQACLRVFGYPFIGPVIDTFALEMQRYNKTGKFAKLTDLRLAGARKRYGLPPHRAHNALNDSIAAAELFLAQVAHINEGNITKLKRLTVLT